MIRVAMVKFVIVTVDKIKVAVTTVAIDSSLNMAAATTTWLPLPLITEYRLTTRVVKKNTIFR